MEEESINFPTIFKWQWGNEQRLWLIRDLGQLNDPLA